MNKIIISPEATRSNMITVTGPGEEFANFASWTKNTKITGVKMFFGASFIDVSRDSPDQIKLDFLRMTKELGYTNVYTFNSMTGKRTKYKSLNEFSII